MNILIVYQGSTGFTEKYAKWIANELKCKVITLKECNHELVKLHDLVIYGSRIHAGTVDKISQFKRIMNNSDKKWLVFANGGTPSGDVEAVKKVWSNSLTPTEQNEIPHFYMQGGLNYDSMKPIDKFIIKAFAGISQKKRNISSIERGRAEALGRSYDATSKEYIYPLIEFIKKNYLVEICRD